MDYKDELASEQLQEAKESKNTAIWVGKLSNAAFVYLPINLACAILGMNLAVYGQGETPVWVFFLLAMLFGLLVYLPVYRTSIDQRKVRLCNVTFHPALCSPSAGFWFLAFTLTHTLSQNFEILNSGLAQVLLGYTGPRTKGWTATRNDRFFEKATWGNQEFWKEKVKIILSAVEGLSFNDEPTRLTV